MIGVAIGNYRVERLLGSGGMGSVYLLRHVRLPNTFAALKVLKASAREMGDRFEQEALAAAAIGGSRVARPLDLGQLADGTPYIMMEYVEGRTLAAELVPQRTLPAVAALRIAYRIADTMAIAHARGIVHRDLKPSNVMLIGDPADPHVKLLDFGVAKASGEMRLAQTVENAIIGSPGYMAPEAATGLGAGDRADVFSLGVTLYKMLSGELPFPAGVDRESISALLSAPTPPLERPANADPVPAGVGALIERTLAKDPAARCSMAEVREGLAAILGPQVPDEPHSPTPSVASKDDPLATTLSVMGSAPDLAKVQAAVSQFVAERAPAPSPPPTARRRRRSRRWLLALGAVPLAIAALALRPRTGNPMLEAATVLACPPLEVAGVEEPSGWLGAGAAYLACRRASWSLGGPGGRTLGPGELLGLPRQPVDDFPVDPFAAADARARMRDAAHRRANAILDGKIDKKGALFHVSLRLERMDGGSIDAAAGSSEQLDEAVFAAVDGLAARGRLPAGRLDPALHRWLPVSGDLAALVDAWFSNTYGRGSEGGRAQCPKLFARRNELGPVAAWIAPSCKSFVPEWSVTPTKNASDAERLWRTVAAADEMLEAHRTFGPAEREELTWLLREVRHPWVLALAQQAAAEAWYAAGDLDRARSAAYAAVETDPDSILWVVVHLVANSGNAVPAAVRASAAWVPGRAYSWVASYKRASPEEQARFAARAYTLEGRSPAALDILGKALLATGKPEQARLVAQKFEPTNPVERIAQAEVLALVEAGEGSVGAAERRLREALATDGVAQHAPWSSEEVRAHVDAVHSAIVLSDLVGDSRSFADLWIERVLLPLKDSYALGASERLVTVCLHASPAPAQKCLERIETTTSGSWLSMHRKELLEGAHKLLNGDSRGAAASWRPIAADPQDERTLLPAEPFEAAGELDLADRIDLRSEAQLTPINGVGVATVGRARRARLRGDSEAARKLAETVVAHWSALDVPVPAVRELRSLLR